MRYLITFACIAFYLNAYSQLSGEYFIGKNEPSPFNTIKSAVNHLNNEGISGDVTFLLTDELYQESEIVISDYSRVSETDRFTLKPANETFCTIIGNGNYVIGFNSAKYITIDGGSSSDGKKLLNITAINDASQTINFIINDAITSKTNNIIIKNCVIKNTSNTNYVNCCIDIGCLYATFNNITIQNNSFSNGNASIDIIGSPINKSGEVSIIGNEFKNAGGILIEKCEKVIFKNNILEKISLMEPITGSVNYAIALSNINNLQFFNNQISDILFTETNLEMRYIHLREIKSGAIYNNEIKNICYPAHWSQVSLIGGNVHIFDIYGCEELQIQYNSIYIPKGDESGLVYDNAYISAIHIHLQDINSKITVQNNIFRISQGNKTDKDFNTFGYIITVQSISDYDKLYCNHNIYYTENQANNFFSGQTITTLPPTQTYSFDQWKASYPVNDQNSYWKIPVFISKDNLHLAKDCNLGTPLLNIANDLDSIERNIYTPDIGAYEYVKYMGIEHIGDCQASVSEFKLTNTNLLNSTLWHFGDNQTSTELSPTHTYTQAGKYTVSVEITYTDSTTETIRKEIEIYEKPQKPIIKYNVE